MAEGSPTVIVLAGCNGAGKTTSARTLLAETLHLMTYVNADVIAQGLSGFNPESTALEAGRIMLDRLHQLAEQRADFAFETTLAGRAYAPWLRKLRGEGYAITLLYFWLQSPELAIARVAIRVRQGGHHIPEATIRQRYERSTNNFFSLYRPIAKSWRVYDNTQLASPVLIAHGGDKGNEVVLNGIQWEQMQKDRKP
jgi:predicted ABC-type ATPase